MSALPVIDICVLLAYLVGVVALGLWFGRKGLSSEQFMAAGRRIPAWAVGLSIFGTYVSSISFLALPGKAFATNWNAFVFSLSIPVTTWFAVKYFVPFYRRSGEVSAYQHLEKRFGPWARTYAVVCYLLTQLARMGTILYLLALALAPLTGWSIPTIILGAGLLVIVYTLVGGMEAVIWTDVVQSIIFIGGAFACVAILLFGMPQGPAQLFEIASEHNKFSLGSFDPDFSTMTFWVVLLNGIFINLQNFGIDQSYVQRYQTAKTDEAAARSVWLGALLYLPISAVFFFIGTGLFAFYSARPELLPASVDALNKPDSVFPHFIVAQLPVGVTGLVIASIFAAAQSTVSSSVNCSATLILCDVYQRYFRPAASEWESMRVLHVATLVFGVAGIGMALAMMQIKNALDAWWGLASIFSGGMLGLFLLGLLATRAGNRAAAVGVVSGVVVIAWMTFSPRWTGWGSSYRSPFHTLLVVVISTLTILLVGWIASMFMRRRQLQLPVETRTPPGESVERKH
ncbi:MAG TPA: sodium:solute symporter [Verrucomicrobiae bacterium]|nr:sodium:solute symporter [Verrucomicrobiae bacterium]